MGFPKGSQGLLHLHQSKRDPQNQRMWITRMLCFGLSLTRVSHQIIDVIGKTLAFHTSTNYEIRAPEPFTSVVHENVPADLARISKQQYRSDYDLHIDFSRTLKRLNDGHCVWVNRCYVSDNR